MINKKNILLIGVLFAVSVLFSCVKNDIGGSSGNIANEEKKVALSPLASDPSFVNSLHFIRNPETNSMMIVKGDGTVVLKSIVSVSEGLSLIDDIDPNTTNYMYKIYNGEKIDRSTYDGADGEEYDSIDASRRVVYYDKNGKEVGLEIKDQPSFSTKDKIIYSDYSVSYEDNQVRVFDVNTKKITTPDYAAIDYMNGKIIMSTYEYSKDFDNDEVAICDEDFNVIKKIEGYTLNGVYRKNNYQVATLKKRIKKGKDGDYDTKMNYIDKDFNLVFDEDIDNWLEFKKYPIVTVVKGDKEFDFNFETREKVSEDRIHVEREVEWQVIQNEKEKYEKEKAKIKKKHKEYQYVNPLLLKGKVWYVAYKEYGTGMFENTPCDIYNDKLEKVLEIDDLTNTFETYGYIFANHDTIYDSDMKVALKFDEKCNMESAEKFDKKFLTNRMDMEYHERKNFTLFDADLNVVHDNLSSIDLYTYDEYIALSDKNGTEILDKDLNVVKTLDRSISIKGWNEDEIPYKIFIDMNTNRMGIIDSNFNIVVDNIKKIEFLKEKYFTCVNGFNYGLMDYSGLPILSFSIFDTMSEDAREEDFAGKFVE